MTPIGIALVLLQVHAALGAFDTFHNHEWKERLPQPPQAQAELALHSARSWLFADPDALVRHAIGEAAMQEALRAAGIEDARGARLVLLEPVPSPC